MSERVAQGQQRSLVELLGATTIFSGLDDKHLARLASIGSEESFARNAHIFREGDVGDKFYLVLDGAVRISRQVPGMGEEALTILRAGAGFGEMSLIDDSPRSADVLAHEACRLFVVRKEDLEDLLFVDRDLAYSVLWRLVRILSGRLRETTDKMMFLSFAGKFE
jgi:CRP/FNR family transcriptional regulator, cyclic AMP receptor protein